MRTKTLKTKPWSELTQEERAIRVRAGFGKYKGLTGGTAEFQKYKEEEIDLEEERAERWARGKNGKK